MTKLFNNLFIACDAPRPWGTYFQDSASPQMEALVELHDNIMFYLVIILFGVGWILISIVRNYVNDKSPISNKYLNHGTLIELIWTITPALILILIAFPSFKLLYLMDEVTDPSLTVFVKGHQWYWSYQYPDFINDDAEELEFDSYLVPESDLEEGALLAESNHTNGIGDELALSLEQQELLKIGSCTHDSAFPLPLDIPATQQDPIKCDLNPTRTDSGLVKHDAFRGGISPTVCANCHCIMCHDCTNTDQDSE